MSTRREIEQLSRKWNYSCHKVGVLCGNFLEVIETPERQQGPLPAKERTGKTDETPEERLERSAGRARRAVRRLVNCNNMYGLHTLTYAVEHPQYFHGEKPFDLVPVEHQKDRDKVIEHWKEFARKMRKYALKRNLYFHYVAVIEKHTGKRAKDATIKQDTYHIHFVAPQIWGKRLLQAKWRHGFCNFADWTQGRKSQDMQDRYDAPPPDNPGAYMSKYIGKDMSSDTEGGLLNKKRYWASRELARPVPVSQNDIHLMLKHRFTEINRKVRKVTIEERTFTTTFITYRLDDSPYQHLLGTYYATPHDAREAQKRNKMLWADIQDKLHILEGAKPL